MTIHQQRALLHRLNIVLRITRGYRSTTLVVGTVDAKRAGRPWGPARGSCQEINELVAIIRGWLDEAGVSVKALHRELTPEHFANQRVPELSRLRERLAGVDLAWEVVEAVADICFPDDSADATLHRLKQAKLLWDAAERSPTPLEAAEPQLALTKELLAAKDRTIAAYQEIDRARQAYQASEHGRHQALQAATLVFALLGQAQAKIAELSRRLDAVQARSSDDPQAVEPLRRRLERAQGQEQKIRAALARAEEERDTAQRVADHAARRIRRLETEVATLRTGGTGLPETDRASDSQNGLQSVEIPSADPADAAMDDVDRALDKVREVLEHGHEAVQEAAEEVGWKAEPEPAQQGDERGWRTVPGQVLKSSEHAPPGAPDSPQGDESDLFRTTRDNPLASGDRASRMVIAQRSSEDRHRYVGAATRRISRGLDLDEIVLGLCRSAVPAFADAIMIYLRDPLPVGDKRPSGPLRMRLRRADGGLEGPADWDAPVGALPGLPALERAYGSESISVTLDGPLADVLRRVRPVFADSVKAADALSELLGHPENPLSTGRRALLAPLRGLRRVIGAVVLLRHTDRAPFEADDLLVAAQIATQTALGVDKAALYGREAHMVDALQREMLPFSLPQPTGVQLASRYLPAAESARVGGDWYDAIPLPGSRVALMVGDVMGHSMTSAAVMGQLRTTVQTLAGLDLAPQEVLYHLDEQAQRLGQDRMATCVYAVYDPIAHRLVVANAGHPPPVLLHADGQAEVLRVPPGAPIGVGGVPFEAVEMPAPAGATLLLYTDGLVESRSRDVWGGIELLRERLHDAAAVVSPPPLEPLCDEVLEILGPGDRDDDVALLAARFDGIARSG